MALTNPTNNATDVVSVELPVARRFRVLLGVFWMLLGLTEIIVYRHPRHPEDQIGYLLFGIVYILMGFLYSWESLAHHRISVSRKELKFEMAGLGMKRTRHYALGEIKNLRVHGQWTFARQPRIAIDRAGKRRFISYELAPSSPPNLLDPIYERFPQLAPRN